MASLAAAPPRSWCPRAAAGPGDDPIFALNAEANARKAKGESVVNATLGALLDDTGALAVLPTAARAVKEVRRRGLGHLRPHRRQPRVPGGRRRDLFPAPRRPAQGLRRRGHARRHGGAAPRHRDVPRAAPALLTTSFYWGPYATLADENERGIDTFPMFDAARRLRRGGPGRGAGPRTSRRRAARS